MEKAATFNNNQINFRGRRSWRDYEWRQTSAAVPNFGKENRKINKELKR